MRYMETDRIRKRLLLAGGLGCISAPFVVGALLFGGWVAAVVTVGLCVGAIVFVAGVLMLMEAFD